MKKTIVVSADRGETRVAVLEAKTVKSKREVAEVYIERRGGRSLVGNIYLGKVDNVLPGMEAAFVDIGLERNGFLHVDEILLPDGQQAPRRGRGQGRRIDELIKPKQEILVQVIKDPIKSKGARLSMNVTIAGRYLVYAPNGTGVGVSRRLADKERDRLRRMVSRTYDGPGGLIVRTAAHGAKKADFTREIAYLHRLDAVLEKRREGAKAPSLVFQEQDLPVRVLRDVFLNEFDKAIIDDQKQFDRVTSFFQRTAPELVEGVEHYKGKKPLFEKWEIERAIQSTLGRRIDLPSGGYLIIDYTEALTVIDVNSGSFTGRGKGGLEETITKVNTEAASEVVRQLRLRDIGGIIVIDFIDMAKGKNRDKVLGTLREALDADKSKSYLVEISPLGLVEMTRQNITDGVREILTVQCPTCEGEGVVLSAETVALEGLRKMKEIAADHAGDEAFLVRVNPKVAALLNDSDSGLLELEEETGKQFHFEGGEALAIDNFELIESGEKSSIEERALPFRPGEEVFVKIEEPHMYNADDAIARIDSYIISITGAANAVGERKMVRIQSVERASAVAELLPEEAQPKETKKAAPRKKNGSGQNAGRSENGKASASGRGPKQETGNRGNDRQGRSGQGSKNGSDPKPKAESAVKKDAEGEKEDKPVKSGPFGLRRGRRRRGKKKEDAGS
ncbi:MAG TPA: Rne/Rng family ribonuclease [Solirubrobacterales bacterium]|jgi:ribonuclease G|nr:Rne/Rng family ribonuclease [Solirubrobacterales bacterium]HMU26235.1 Rne/Rng family ribonuclease [Solirubrobacterales bacterium]HMX71225.1 Rne/Rng family ribonuclease [Solirubrobacterales bacterium]HMY25028.1 Rne/Rng family ribonuclease [Solirubrobacterales bacterium]HNA23229.1 Rne/Rng family ribonuclease [Solirubrobacterales bacterium]